MELPNPFQFIIFVSAVGGIALVWGQFTARCWGTIWNLEDQILFPPKKPRLRFEVHERHSDADTGEESD